VCGRGGRLTPFKSDAAPWADLPVTIPIATPDVSADPGINNDTTQNGQPNLGAFFLHPNHQGSTSLITSASSDIAPAIVVSEIHYKPYGEVYRPASSGSDISRYKYTAQEEDPESELMYYNARFYDPAIGRFISADTIIDPGAGNMGFNRYMYVAGNPVNYSDPSGHELITAIVLIIAAVAGGAAGYRVAEQNGYGWDDWQTYGYIIGGAAIGAASAGIGIGVSGATIPFANTLAIASSSFSYTMGFSMLSGGEYTPSVSFGFASYDFDNKKWNYLFDGDNEWYEDMAYFFGALAFVSDVFALFGDAETITVNAAEVEKEETWSHTSITDEADESIVSVGPSFDENQNYIYEDGSKRGYFGKIKPDPKWDTYVDNTETWKVKLHNVNTNALNNYTPKSWNLYPNSCTNHAAKALWTAGVPTLPINFHPFLLNTQLAIRQVGIYTNPFLSTIDE